MVYYKRVTCPLSKLAQVVMELTSQYNRISIHLKGSKQHTRKGLKDEIAYLIAHNQ